MFLFLFKPAHATPIKVGNDGFGPPRIPRWRMAKREGVWLFCKPRTPPSLWHLEVGMERGSRPPRIQQWPPKYDGDELRSAVSSMYLHRDTVEPPYQKQMLSLLYLTTPGQTLKQRKRKMLPAFPTSPLLTRVCSYRFSLF
ncbi:hypothetical protein VTH06DRAFT_1971 [Thermothelomyces fergusii]